MTRNEAQEQIDEYMNPKVNVRPEWAYDVISAICEVEHGDAEISNQLWQLDKIKQVVGKFR